MEFSKEDEQFFALFATEHGKGPARMLSSYPELFGHKAICGVGIFCRGGHPDLCWILEERDKPISPVHVLPSSPLSKKQNSKTHTSLLNFSGPR